MSYLDLVGRWSVWSGMLCNARDYTKNIPLPAATVSKRADPGGKKAVNPSGRPVRTVTGAVRFRGESGGEVSRPAWAGAKSDLKL